MRPSRASRLKLHISAVLAKPSLRRWRTRSCLLTNQPNYVIGGRDFSISMNLTEPAARCSISTMAKLAKDCAIAKRVDQLDWSQIRQALEADGFATLEPILSPAE